MLVSIQPVEAADIPAFARLQLEAFASHPRTPMMWRKGYTDQVYAYHESKTRESLRDPECRLIKAVDDETGAMVGVSEITFALNIETNRNQRPVGEDDSPPDNWPEGGNWEMRQWYKRNALALLRESFDGVPYILVDILTVSPSHQARGIGSELLRWAVKEADLRGVAMGLESTPAGLALYERFGFQQKRVIKADMKSFGWTEDYDEEAAKRVWMVREAR